MLRKNKSVGETIDGKKMKIAVVVSRFNDDITANMLSGALENLKNNGVDEKNIRVVWVPGAYELPLACQKLADAKKIDGIVAIGCVIKGDTDHYYYIAGEASRGIMEVMLRYSIPIGFGVITVNNLKQANERSGRESNKGYEAAQAALEMIKNH